MDLDFNDLALIGRALDTFKTKQLDKFKRVTKILGGHQMGVATMHLNQGSFERMRSDVVECQHDISSTDSLSSRIRAELVRVTGEASHERETARR